MKFQVVNRDNIPVMCTESVSCVPDEKELLSMQKAGYKFKVDGKVMTIKKIKEMKNRQGELQ